MNPHEPSMTPQQRELSQSCGLAALAKYRELVCAQGSMFLFLYFEFVTTLFSNMAGLVGFLGRAVSYRFLFKALDGNVAFGRGVTLRNPKAVTLGKGVLVDDWAVIDPRGDRAAIDLEHNVSIGRFSSLVAKSATIRLHSAANIGSYCRIATQSRVEIGDSTLVGAYCYIGPGNHQAGDENTPLIEQPMDIKGGVFIGKHCWLGTRVTVLDGVTIGDGAIVGAHSLVKEDVPAGATVVGVPAKIVRMGPVVT